MAALRFQDACELAVPEEAQYEQHEDHYEDDPKNAHALPPSTAGWNGEAADSVTRSLASAPDNGRRVFSHGLARTRSR